MKKSISALILTVCCISNIINAGKIYIKNQYKYPIIVNLNGNDIRELQTGESDFLSFDPKQIKIRAKNSSMYHSGIQQRYNEIKGAVLPNPGLQGTIIVLNTNNPFSFSYDTKIEKIASPTYNYTHVYIPVKATGNSAEEQFINEPDNNGAIKFINKIKDLKNIRF